MKQKLALGHQEFSEVIGNNCIYVDKTEAIYNLINDGSYFFLSRPRRFGKSLLANTIKELFLGNKKLFKGLWIEDKWNWEQAYPVIKISFSNIAYDVIGLDRSINNMLDNIAKEYNIIYKSESYPEKFKELIIKLSEKAPVAIIIDEYDKPIIDYLTELDKAEENKKILKNFYSILKDSDNYIKFLFITGVSKFSQVSIFSDLNNLIDITINENYSQIVGWTKEEIEKYFPDYIKEVAEKYKDIYPEIMPEIKRMYNGYSWDGQNFLHNPWSIMSLFHSREFGSYWFATGTPTFLMDLIAEQKYTAFDLEDKDIPQLMLEKYEIQNINIHSLLFQTGYLTIKNKNLRTRELTLGFPNQEVEESFSYFLLSKLTIDRTDTTTNILFDIKNAFKRNEIDEMVESINILFENIPSILIHKTEKYFHSLFFLIVKMIGFDVETEILTLKGRIDAVIKTETHIYIVEFKIDQSAEKAIQQIKDKQYALKYADDNRSIMLIGINFDTQKKVIEDYIVEKY